MAEINKSDKLKIFVEAYGAAVRAGVITPCLQDENDIRKIFGLQKAPPEVVQDWKSTNGIRKPITLSKDGDGTVAEVNTDDNQK